MCPCNIAIFRGQARAAALDLPTAAARVSKADDLQQAVAIYIDAT
jgi:hypothetical protein